ncbi:MAG TPA: hypothetical protein VF004_07215 [Burkholderiales bacterium]
MSDERKISERYRELPLEEPPRHLDDAILAASRRETRSRPAPLVVPSGRRRWYFPVAAAAIIVLAVAVTVHMERDEENLEVAEAPAPATAGKRETLTPDPQPAPAPPLRDLYKAQPAQPAPEAPPPPAEQPANRARAMARADAEQAQAREETRSAAAPPARAASDRLASAAAVASPEQWLQGIADLRRQGRHEEADRQLAEFRKRYPDYRIPDAIGGTMEKR